MHGVACIYVHCMYHATQSIHRNFSNNMKIHVYVVVNFLSQVIFVFLLCMGMVIYVNEVETKEKQKLPMIKN